MPAYADSCTNAYANPSATPAFVTFTARDAAGEVLARVVRTLLPGGHDAHGMMSLFGLTSFTGSIEVTSTEPIVSLSLNFEAAPVFSSLASGGTGCFRAVIDLFKPSFGASIIGAIRGASPLLQASPAPAALRWGCCSHSCHCRPFFLC